MSKPFPENLGHQSHIRSDDKIYKGDAPDDYPKITASRADMFKAGTGIQWRDSCAHLLLPLNECRREHPWTWQCEDQKHAYEKCQYEVFEYKRKELDRRLAQQYLDNKAK